MRGQTCQSSRYPRARAQIPARFAGPDRFGLQYCCIRVCAQMTASLTTLSGAAIQCGTRDASHASRSGVFAGMNEWDIEQYEQQPRAPRSAKERSCPKQSHNWPVLGRTRTGRLEKSGSQADQRFKGLHVEGRARSRFIPGRACTRRRNSPSRPLSREYEAPWAAGGLPEQITSITTRGTLRCMQSTPGSVKARRASAHTSRNSRLLPPPSTSPP